MMECHRFKVFMIKICPAPSKIENWPRKQSLLYIVRSVPSLNLQLLFIKIIFIIKLRHINYINVCMDCSFECHMGSGLGEEHYYTFGLDFHILLENLHHSIFTIHVSLLWWWRGWWRRISLISIRVLILITSIRISSIRVSSIRISPIRVTSIRVSISLIAVRIGRRRWRWLLLST